MFYGIIRRQFMAKDGTGMDRVVCQHGSPIIHECYQQWMSNIMTGHCYQTCAKALIRSVDHVQDGLQVLMKGINKQLIPTMTAHGACGLSWWVTAMLQHWEHVTTKKRELVGSPIHNDQISWIQPQLLIKSPVSQLNLYMNLLWWFISRSHEQH